jgi:hypothetical protein
MDQVGIGFIVVIGLVIVGVPLVAALRRRAVRRLFARLDLAVAPERAAPGGELTLRAAAVPRAPLPVRAIELLIECEQYASEPDRLRDTSADRSLVAIHHRAALFADGTLGPPGLPEWSTTARLPPDALPSLRLRSHRILWRAVLRVDVAGRRELQVVRRFVVCPALAPEAAATAPAAPAPERLELAPTGKTARCRVALEGPPVLTAGAPLVATLIVAAREAVRLRGVRASLVWRTEGTARPERRTAARALVAREERRLAAGEERRWELRLEVPAEPVTTVGTLFRLGWVLRVELEGSAPSERHERPIVVRPGRGGP